MFARYFIERPIFASVISIVLVICGAIAYFVLPTTQYPEITPRNEFFYVNDDAQIVAIRYND